MMIFSAPRDDSRSRRTDAVDDDTRRAEILLHEAERVRHCRRAGNRRSVLVVVEHGNVHFLNQLVLNVVAFRGLDVLQIDARKARLQIADRFHKFVLVRRVEADRHRVDVRKHFVKHRFAFHDRHSRFRSDVAKAENACTVRHNRNHIAAAGIFKGKVLVFTNFPAWLSDAGRVKHAQVMRVFQLCFGHRRKFSVVFLMDLESFFV